MKWNGRLFGVFLALCCWVVNPAYLMGCGGERGFTFGEAEMLSLMETLEQETWQVDQAGEVYELIFDLEQSDILELARRSKPGLVGSAMACEDRSFVASASACVDMSYLGIKGPVDVVQRATDELVHSKQTLTGTMTVMGLDLSNVDISLSHADGSFSFSSTDGTQLNLNDATW